ncbi:hypothetical protein VTK73DRAFT_7295 [Phialemonium thermophilum]|uniref:Uncharacterized protein n=1 Tax=Phialemonium thermophilum TaxID=223376 RepID=A0ABR3WFI7_9PEZI
MPFDKATQHSLGLFHGLPSWWKKHQAELARQQQQDEEEAAADNGGGSAKSDLPVVISRVGGGGGGGGGSQDGVSGSGGGHLGVRDRGLGGAGRPASGGGNAGPAWRRAGQTQTPPVAQFSSPFGPIGPPSSRRSMADQGVNRATRGIADMNPFSMLGQVDEGRENRQYDEDLVLP